MSLPPKIAIVGAGPAGCTLARLLVRASIPVTLFEGESSLSVRAQGGTLDLHTNTGLKALREAGLYEEYLKCARYDGEALAVTDKNLKPFIRLGGATEKTSRGRPEIDRARLRQILVEFLPSDTIRWNCRLRSIDHNDLSLHFDHGIETGFDLVVGADGAWSKVRPALIDTKPFYAGIGGYDLFIDDAEIHHPDLHKLVNRGSVFAYSDGKSITGQQRGDGGIIVYATSVRDENWRKTCGYDIQNAGEVKKAIAKEFGDWAEPLVKLTQVANEKTIVARSLYMLPVGARWENRTGVTLIGDAAHLATPFAGEGVNVAMEDALSLAQAIIRSAKAGDTTKILSASVEEFEKEMFPRAAAVQDHSKTNMELMFFTPGAPRTTIDRYVRRALGQGWLIEILLPLWLVRSLLRIFFWW
ncbi:hypothetical protein MMC28_004722 [Mycoblastus sanguinarius]|nr:hypothetical protein [Mycoblastus sanguinarius]